MAKLIFIIIDAQVVLRHSPSPFCRMLRANVHPRIFLRHYDMRTVDVKRWLQALVWFQPRLTLCYVLRMFYIFHCLHSGSHSHTRSIIRGVAFICWSIVFVTAYFVIHKHMYIVHSSSLSSCVLVLLVNATRRTLLIHRQ